MLTGNEADPKDPKVGKVLGGGKIKKEFPFVLLIKEGRRSVKTAAILMNVINQRFHQHKGVDEQGVVSAKDVSKPDKHLNITVPQVYHQNEARFFLVVKQLPLVTTPELEKQRIQECRKQLMDPKTTAKAALKLEAYGPNSIPLLKEGLKSENGQVRFFAAEALAYLHDGSGTEILAENVVKQPKFRIFALAALAAMDQPPAYMALRKLMNEPEISVRYGAFNAIRLTDEHDSALGRVPVYDIPTPTREDQDSMAVRSVGRAALRMGGGGSRFANDPFELYVVDSDGPPLVHVSTTHRCEIVLFGMGQKLLTPMILSGGTNLLVNAAEGDELIQVSKIGTKNLDGPEKKVMVPRDTEEVIKAMAKLGASYPEIVTVLFGAQSQKNLPGPLAFDAVPKFDEGYLRAMILGEDQTAKKDSGVKRTSGEDDERDGFLSWIRKKIGRD